MDLGSHPSDLSGLDQFGISPKMELESGPNSPKPFSAASHENHTVSQEDGFPASNWEQDVLLSNAVLPEVNPLLELDDDHSNVEEDLQKMLNEWESHIGSMQVMFTFWR